MDQDQTADLAELTTLGRFLLDNYQNENGINVPRFLANVVDLCERFGVDFDAALSQVRSEEVTR